MRVADDKRHGDRQSGIADGDGDCDGAASVDGDNGQWRNVADGTADGDSDLDGVHWHDILDVGRGADDNCSADDDDNADANDDARLRRW